MQSTQVLIFDKLNNGQPPVGLLNYRGTGSSGLLSINSNDEVNLFSTLREN